MCEAAVRLAELAPVVLAWAAEQLDDEQREVPALDGHVDALEVRRQGRIGEHALVELLHHHAYRLGPAQAV